MESPLAQQVVLVKPMFGVRVQAVGKRGKKLVVVRQGKASDPKRFPNLILRANIFITLDAPINAVQVRLQAHADPVGLGRHERLHLLLRQLDAALLGGGTELGFRTAS